MCFFGLCAVGFAGIASSFRPTVAFGCDTGQTMAENNMTPPWLLPNVGDLLRSVAAADDKNEPLNAATAAWDGIPLTVLEHFNWTPAESVAIHSQRRAKTKKKTTRSLRGQPAVDGVVHDDLIQNYCDKMKTLMPTSCPV